MGLKSTEDKWVCDNCGKEETTHDGERPSGWYELSFIQVPAAAAIQQQIDLDNVEHYQQDACSGDCLLVLVAKAGPLILAADPGMMCLISVVKEEPHLPTDGIS